MLHSGQSLGSFLFVFIDCCKYVVCNDSAYYIYDNLHYHHLTSYSFHVRTINMNMKE